MYKMQAHSSNPIVAMRKKNPSLLKGDNFYSHYKIKIYTYSKGALLRPDAMV